MELIYRGVRYSNDKAGFSTATEVKKDSNTASSESKTATNPNFPLFRYIKQLLARSDSKPVFDPITYWYLHKSQFLEHCWQIDDRIKLERCWYLTLVLQSKTNRTNHQPIKLKYRGVTYYR